MRRIDAFTIIELSLVLGVIGVLAAMGTSGFARYQERARMAQVVIDMKSMSELIDGFEVSNMGVLPTSLAEAGADGFVDPWGNPYEYLRLDINPPGKARKDKFLVPINSDYDLYSMGPDGRSVAPLTAKHSRDDIIRASDGSFYGRAQDF